MHDKIDEPIDVLAKFSTVKNKVVPLYIRWREKLYKIDRVNMVHRQGRGDDKIYYFSVSDNANFFRLAFFTRDLSWRIEEIFTE